MKDLADDKGDELALFRWKKHGLDPPVFQDERTSWGVRHCLKKMGEFDRNVLIFAERKIVKRMRKHSQGRGSFRPWRRPSMILMDRSTF